MFDHQTRADDSDIPRSIRMRYNQQPIGLRRPESDEPMLVLRVIRIEKRNRQWIPEHRGGLVKRYAMFPRVRCRLCFIPFEFHYYFSSLF
jgi:hypothetical protein